MRKVVLILFLVSCSPLSELIIQEPKEELVSAEPWTKSSVYTTRLNYHKAVHFAQSNHINMIIKHVQLKDSLYVQTLSADDFNALGFSQEEIDFSNQYINVINEQLKQDLYEK
ncbi:MAG: hypothetical protein J5640_06280 [Bacteroidales bacterium]|nr:hypothetical protein [Bacteroidales bacterium]